MLSERFSKIYFSYEAICMSKLHEYVYKLNAISYVHAFVINWSDLGFCLLRQNDFMSFTSRTKIFENMESL
jgi:hypothetical protein